MCLSFHIARFYKNHLSGIYKNGILACIAQYNHKTLGLCGWLCSCINFLKVRMDKTCDASRKEKNTACIKRRSRAQTKLLGDT